MRKQRKQTGTFLGVPYDWRRPTSVRFRIRAWNRREPRLFVPKMYGWGWSVNFARLRPQKRTSRLHFFR
jgi:hypothetical protein